MRPLTTAELSRMTRTSNAGMLDTCRILAHVEGAKDSYNRPSEQHGDPGPEIRCTLLEERASEYQPTGQQTPQATVRLRVPVGTVISSRDQVQVTKRFGRSVPTVTYRVIGEPMAMIDAIEMQVEAV